MIHELPPSTLQQHIAILGKTGSGKSYAAKGAVEKLLTDGKRVCVIDPTGAWWGLKSSASGKSGGFPVVIFGGSHSDLPLSGTHGEAMAEIIGTSSTPAIIDTSMLKISERTRFFADFADALVRKNKGPLQLVIDEAHLFAPQGKVSDPQSGAMLHAANNLVSLGRSRGLRIVLITQRPAKLHKDSLTQVETLVAMRLIAPQDRRAVEEWIKDNADEKTGREIIESLATLKTGNGWVWAPEIGILERVSFPRIQTFDSSSAPDGSEHQAVLAPIDRDAIAARLQAVAADAMANDPATLRKEIATLKRQAATKAPSVDTAAIADAERRGFNAGTNHAYTKGWNEYRAALTAALKTIASDPPSVGELVTPPESVTGRVLARKLEVVPRPAQPRGASSASASLGKCEGKILSVLAQHEDGCLIGKLTLLTGYRNSGGFRNSLSNLRTQGLIDGQNTGVMRITRDGLAKGPFDELPQGAALLAYWLNHPSFGPCERRVLHALADEPRGMPIDSLTQATGYENSGGFRNALSNLRTAGVLVGRNTETMRLSNTIL